MKNVTRSVRFVLSMVLVMAMVLTSIGSFGTVAKAQTGRAADGLKGIYRIYHTEDATQRMAPERTRHPRVIRSGCGNRDQLLRQTVRCSILSRQRTEAITGTTSRMQSLSCRQILQLSAFRERMPHQQTRNGRSRKWQEQKISII